jgi:hypothetical protein
MSVRSLLFQLLCVMALTQCGSGGGRASQWQDIDYSKVYRARSGDNDSGYVAPSVINCVDDDLYNCNH